MTLPYRELVVWKRSQALAVQIVDLSERGGWRPFLRDQACRAAFSVSANIAEGNGRSTPLDYASFVDRARGSLFELDSWLHGCRELGLLRPETQAELQEEIEQISAMLLSLARTLRNKPTLGSRKPPSRP